MAKSNDVIFGHVQRYLALGKIESAVKKLKDQEGVIIKKELESRGISFGPVEDFDGPNGGITYSEQNTLVFDADLVECVLGKEIAETCTKRVVDSDVVKAICKVKGMSEKQLREMCSEVKSSRRLVPVYNRADTTKQFVFDLSEVISGKETVESSGR